MIYVTEKMLSTGKPVAQGEVLIWMKKFAPPGAIEALRRGKMAEMQLEGGQLILGHSETGHHHVLEPVDKTVPISKAAMALIDNANETFVELKLMEPCALVHLRGHDTHKGFVLPPGEYIRSIREEQTVDGWRRVVD